MKKLISLFATALFATSLIIAPVSAIENTQSGNLDIVSGACEGVGSDNPTDILSCGGNR